MSGFLVDMAKVFEDFLTATLTRSLEALGGTCRAQDPHALDVAGRMKMDPDLVWYRGGHPATVVDAKYKAEKPAGFLDADVYQLLAHCTALDLAAGHLVYAKGNEPTVTHRIRDSGVTIHAHALDLAATPDAPLADVDRLAYRMDGPSAQTAALPEERSARPPDSTRTLDACVADRAPLSHAPSTRWALRSGRPPGRSCRRPFRRHGLVDGHTRPPSPDGRARGCGMLLVSYLEVRAAQPLECVELPLSVEVGDGVLVTLDARTDEATPDPGGEIRRAAAYRLRVERRVRSEHLSAAPSPSVQRMLPDGTREPVRCLRLEPDSAPERVVVHDMIAALAFLSGIDLRWSQSLRDHRYVPETAADRALLAELGTDRPLVEVHSQTSTRTIPRRVTADRVAALFPRRVGLRLYASALKSDFAPARYRELWRVLESAFARRDKGLIATLAAYPPARQLGFDHNELRQLLVLRGRASHAATRPTASLAEVMDVERLCTEALPRLDNLVERIIVTKRRWGHEGIEVDELEPLMAYVTRDHRLVIRASEP